MQLYNNWAVKNSTLQSGPKREDAKQTGNKSKVIVSSKKAYISTFYLIFYLSRNRSYRQAVYPQYGLHSPLL